MQIHDEQKEQTTIRLPAELSVGLINIAKEQGVDISTALRTILKKFINSYNSNECFQYFFE